MRKVLYSSLSLFTLFIAIVMAQRPEYARPLSSQIPRTIPINRLATTLPQSNLIQLVEDLSRQIEPHMANNQNRTIAVLDFADLSGGVNNFGRFLAEELITHLSKKGFKVIERQLLNKIVATQRLNFAGGIDKSGARKIKKALGVDIIVIGSISDLSDILRINVRLVSTLKGEMQAAVSSQVNKDKSICLLLGGACASTTVSTPVNKTAKPQPQQINKADGPTSTIVLKQNDMRKLKANSQSFSFELERCGMLDTGIACDFLITNDGSERDLYLFLGESKMVDSSSKEYKATFIEFENSRRVTLNNGVGVHGKIKSRVTIKGRIRFDKISQSVDRVASLQMIGKVFEYEVNALFQNIPLTSVSSKELLTTVTNTEPKPLTLPAIPFKGREQTFIITEVNEWLKTDIEVEPGMRLVISAEGTITVRNSRSPTPNPTGIDQVIGRTLKDSKLLERVVGTNDLHAKIIYRWGGESNVIKVGSRTSVLVKLGEEGWLALGIPKPYTGDMSGHISILVQW